MSPREMQTKRNPQIKLVVPFQIGSTRNVGSSVRGVTDGVPNVYRHLLSSRLSRESTNRTKTRFRHLSATKHHSNFPKDHTVVTEKYTSPIATYYCKLRTYHRIIDRNAHRESNQAPSRRALFGASAQHNEVHARHRQCTNHSTVPVPNLGTRI